MKHITTLLLATYLLTLNASQESADSLISSLQKDMQKFSNIATQTRHNIDYMPYVISVFNSEELLQLGVINLREALTLIPGVDLSVGMAGVQNPIFRGSNPYAMGQSKLIIDGIVVNDTMFGAYNQYLNMPIDIIERIEVIRGPGSELSFTNGYAGSVHIITKANKDDGTKEAQTKLFALAGSDAYRSAGLIAYHKDATVKFSGDLFYQEHDRALDTGVDRFNKTGLAPMWLEDYSLGINAEYGQGSLKIRTSKNSNGVSYGQAFSITEDPSDHLNLLSNYAEFSHTFKMNENLTSTVTVGYQDQKRDLQNKVLADGVMGNPDGRYFVVDYSESTLYERLEFDFTGLSDHHIKSGLMHTTNNVHNNVAQNSTDKLVSFTTAPLLATTYREKYSLFAEDLINYSEKVSIQVGAKVDRISDVKTLFSPRIAWVYRANNSNIYKLNYTNAYREPSWREQYLVGTHFFSATRTMEPEIVDAFEASYIKKFSAQEFVKVNTFVLQNHDQIHAQNSTRTFKNSGDHTLYGFETEFAANIADYHKFYANYSYVDGENTGNVLSGSAQEMVKSYYIHNITHNLSLSTVIKYVGARQRIETDTRSEVPSYTTCDLTLGYQHKKTQSRISLGAKNLFDATYYLPSPENTYPDDFKQAGISYFIRLEKRL